MDENDLWLKEMRESEERENREGAGWFETYKLMRVPTNMDIPTSYSRKLGETTKGYQTKLF